MCDPQPSLDTHRIQNRPDHKRYAFVVRKYDERDYGEYRTRRLVLDAYDRMASAIANGGSAAP